MFLKAPLTEIVFSIPKKKTFLVSFVVCFQVVVFFCFFFFFLSIIVVVAVIISFYRHFL